MLPRRPIPGAEELVADRRSVFRLPSTVTSMESGAGLVSVYLTAYYALVHLARVREGDTILVHAAMGGVGQVPTP
eukprot:1189497-Prorocentrum_minimum.AAC.3